MNSTTNENFKLNAATAVAILALAAAWWQFGIAPIGTALATATALELSLDEAQTARLSAEARLAEANVRERDLRAAIADLPFQLRDPDQINTLLADLAHEASRLGVTLDAVTPSEPVAKDRYRLTPIELRASAGYIEFGRWLSALRDRFPDVSLTRLAVERDDQGRARGSITLVWFSAPTAPPVQTTPSNPATGN